jgi:hypothetical protein
MENMVDQLIESIHNVICDILFRCIYHFPSDKYYIRFLVQLIILTDPIFKTWTHLTITTSIYNISNSQFQTLKIIGKTLIEKKKDSVY